MCAELQLVLLHSRVVALFCSRLLVVVAFHIPIFLEIPKSFGLNSKISTYGERKLLAILLGKSNNAKKELLSTLSSTCDDVPLYCMYSFGLRSGFNALKKSLLTRLRQAKFLAYYKIASEASSR